VIGFVLSAPGAERVYVSGDNASLDVVRAISERVGDIAIAVLFAGAVQLARKFDGAYLTLSSDHAADAAKILGVRGVVPVHFEITLPLSIALGIVAVVIGTGSCSSR
jgi:L-ascorbate metabolism protein UlaG (beta-lactamase superfamily)